MRSAEIGLKFDCDAFMSSADDCYLALLCRMFAKIAIFCTMAQFTNFFALFCYDFDCDAGNARQAFKAYQSQEAIERLFEHSNNLLQVAFKAYQIGAN